MNEVLSRAAELKSGLDSSIRQLQMNRISEKELSLSALQKKVIDEEAELDQIESRLIAQELAWKQRRPIPFLTFILCTVISGAFGKYVYDHYEFEPRPPPPVSTYTPSSIQSPTRTVDTPSARTSGQTVLDTYNGIDMDDGDFDVGGYCLKQEKAGAMTFEECLGIAMAKGYNKIQNGQ